MDMKQFRIDLCRFFEELEYQKNQVIKLLSDPDPEAAGGLLIVILLIYGAVSLSMDLWWMLFQYKILIFGH